MSGFSTLAVATSGLRAAQTGLGVIGHNMSNVDTKGYSRQQVIQQDLFYSNIGRGNYGLLQVGLGTDVQQIRQVRNTFLDISYRDEASKMNYYDVKYNTGMEIQQILGELQSDYNTQSVLQDLWGAINELTMSPDGLETRGTFISTCVTFLDKMSNVYDRLQSYQYNLNDQVKESVTKINSLAEEIQKYNQLITNNEFSGDHANDYRDARNNALDELSKLVKIDYREQPNGRIDVFVEGKELVVNNMVSKLGLRYTSNENGFVEPVFTKQTQTLPYDPTQNNAIALFSLTGNVGANFGNDDGLLKGLLVSRGIHPANFATDPQPPSTTDPDYATKMKVYEREKFNIDYCTIPKMMKQLDTLVNGIVHLINDAVSPTDGDSATAPYDLEGNQFTEIFVRKTKPRFVDNGTDLVYNEEKTGTDYDYYSLYSIGNIMINPELLQSSGYNKIALSNNGDRGDSSIASGMLSKWGSKLISFEGSENKSIQDFYASIVNGIGVQTNEAQNYMQEQQVLVNQIDNKRKEVSEVSLDEEMKNMMVYQHAYNASARIVNVIDSMIDKIINGTGRVGL